MSDEWTPEGAWGPVRYLSTYLTQLGLHRWAEERGLTDLRHALDALTAATQRADDYFNESMGAFAERDEARRERDEVLARAEQAERERDAHIRVGIDDLGIYMRLRESVERLKATIRRERQRGDTLERWSEDTSARWHDQWEKAAKERNALRSAFCDTDAERLIAGARYAANTCLHCQGMILEAKEDAARIWAQRWKRHAYRMRRDIADMQQAWQTGDVEVCTRMMGDPPERDTIRARTLAEVARAWDDLTPEFEDLIAEGRSSSFYKPTC